MYESNEVSRIPEILTPPTPPTPPHYDDPEPRHTCTDAEKIGILADQGEALQEAAMRLQKDAEDAVKALQGLPDVLKTTVQGSVSESVTKSILEASKAQKDAIQEAAQRVMQAAQDAAQEDIARQKNAADIKGLDKILYAVEGAFAMVAILAVVILLNKFVF